MGKKKKKPQTAYRENRLKAGVLPVFLKTLMIVLLAGASVLATFGLIKNKEQAIAVFGERRSQLFKEKSVVAPAWEEVDGSSLPGKDNNTAAQMEESEESKDGFDENGYKKDQYGRILVEKRDFQSDEMTLLFAGDVLLDDRYAIMATFKKRAGGVLDSFSEETLQEMQNADIFMLNNEFPYTNRGIPTAEKAFTFRAKPEDVKVLDDLGVDIVSVANNHIYDYGEISLLDTLDTLNQDEMPYVGAGRDLSDASQAVYFDMGDVRIAYVSATQIERFDYPDTKGATESSPGVFRCFKETEIFDKIAEAKTHSDFVIAYIHWGTESTDEIDWAQPDLAQKIADAGADLIIGDHPHVLQPIAAVSGVPVIYSVGNYWFNSGSCDTCLVKVTLLNGQFKSFQFMPAKQEGCYTKLLSGGEKARVLDYMRSISGTVMIDEDGYVTF